MNKAEVSASAVSTTPLNFSTRTVHAEYDSAAYHGAINPPLFLSAAYSFPSAAEGVERFAGESDGYLYHRVGNPTVRILERKLASLEGGEAGLVTSSGMAAIAALLWSQLSAGDTVLADNTLYGCTYVLLSRHLARFGVHTTFVDMSQPEEVSAALDTRTRIAFCETPANPTMRLVDIEKIASLCRRNGTLFTVDNTYATPYLQRPLEFGADAVVHSATKYLGGHGDVLAGALISSEAVVDQARFVGVKEMTGGSTAAFDAFLVLRGLKTLAVRMDRHCDSAEYIAGELMGFRGVTRVLYPGLDSFKQRELAKRQMSRSGGMIAVELAGGVRAAHLFLDNLKLVTRATSLGGPETLAQHPASMTHSAYDEKALTRCDISEGLVRISVGLEHHLDIWADLQQALDAALD
jgi:methionine-gamma-lyase